MAGALGAWVVKNMEASTALGENYAAISKSPGLDAGVGAALFCEGAEGKGSLLIFSDCLGEARRSFLSSNSCFFRL